LYILCTTRGNRDEQGKVSLDFLPTLPKDIEWEEEIGQWEEDVPTMKVSDSSS